MVARWGAYTSVAAWQLFNEVDNASLDVNPATYSWHKEMAAHVRAEDTAHGGRIVSESWGLAVGNSIQDSGFYSFFHPNPNPNPNPKVSVR